MGPNDRPATTTSDEMRLQAAREKFSEWDIYPVFGGYLAVPKGTPVIQGMFLEGIAEKIKRRHAQG